MTRGRSRSATSTATASPTWPSATTRDNTLSVFLNNGDGTFQAAANLRLRPNTVAATIADLNGDGKPDLLVANYHANTVSVLLGNGNGTFQALQTYGTALTPESIAVGDLNGDGKPDLVLTSLSGQRGQRAVGQRRWLVPGPDQLCRRQAAL